MKKLLYILFFLNFVNIFSAGTCNVTLGCYVKKNLIFKKVSFNLDSKRYSFDDFKTIVDKKFEENKDDPKFKKFCEETGKENYSELLTEYEILAYNRDYNITELTEIDLTGQEDFDIRYSFTIDKAYDYEFYDIEINDSTKNKISEEFGINENEISTNFKDEIKQLNNFLNNKKLFVNNHEIKYIYQYLKLKLLSEYSLLFTNYQYEHCEFSVLDNVKNGFAFNLGYFKPIPVTIIRKNKETGKEYGKRIEKEKNCSWLNLYDCVEAILKSYFYIKNDTFNDITISKINEYSIADRKNCTEYFIDLQKLKNILRPKQITIEILNEKKTIDELNSEYNNTQRTGTGNSNNTTQGDMGQQKVNCCGCC